MAGLDPAIPLKEARAYHIIGIAGPRVATRGSRKLEPYGADASLSRVQF